VSFLTTFCPRAGNWFGADILWFIYIETASPAESGHEPHAFGPNRCSW